MKKENPQRRKVGRKPKAKPEKYRYVVRMDEDENRQFKLMFSEIRGGASLQIHQIRVAESDY